MKLLLVAAMFMVPTMMSHHKMSPFDITTHNSPRPPERYNNNTETKILTVDRPNFSGRCPKGVPPFEVVACTNIGRDGKADRIVVPNPCQYPDDSYARILCHELGHVNGWPGNHPKQ